MKETLKEIHLPTEDGRIRVLEVPHPILPFDGFLENTPPTLDGVFFDKVCGIFVSRGGWHGFTEVDYLKYDQKLYRYGLRLYRYEQKFPTSSLSEFITEADIPEEGVLSESIDDIEINNISKIVFGD